MTAWEKGELTEAIRLMEQTSERTPNLINRSLLYIEYYRKTGKTDYLQAAEQALLQAGRRQPEDVQLRYLLARVYLYGNEPAKALPIAEELATDYPKNALYLATLSDILYRQGEKEAAIQPLVDAIRYAPRLLTGERILQLQQTDSICYQSIKQSLCVLSPAPDSSPTDFARYGYIARWCGNRVAGDSYLRKAVDDLPNLATPWHLLGDDNKYRLLLFGAFRKELLSTELPEEKAMSDEQLFNMAYQPKFANWYGGKLLLVPNQ